MTSTPDFFTLTKVVYNSVILETRLSVLKGAENVKELQKVKQVRCLTSLVYTGNIFKGGEVL